MSDPRRALLDVNVLIALFNDTHVHHEVAHDWFDDHRAFGWATCAVMENGFLRILSPRGADVETDRATLFASLRKFCSSGHHEFCPTASRPSTRTSRCTRSGARRAITCT